MFKNNLLIRSGILGIVLSAFFTSCGPEFNELEIPPIENYKLGLPFINGDSSVGFADLLSDEDLENLMTDPNTGGLFFSFEDSFDIASTEELVQAFGSDDATEESFFNINFPDPIPGVPGGQLPLNSPVTLPFSTTGDGCTPANPCIVMRNDTNEGEIALSYMRFERGGLQVTYNANDGDVIRVEMRNVRNGNETTVFVEQTFSAPNTEQQVVLDLAGVELELTNAASPVQLYVSLTNSSGGSTTGNITGIEMTSGNSTDRVKLLFLQPKNAVVDVPTETIDTDYLSNIFPEDATLKFAEPSIVFTFNNPLGADIAIDLSENAPTKKGIYGVNIDGVESPMTFSSDEAETSCSAVIDVTEATTFEAPAETDVYTCNADELLNIRPINIVYDGEARYSLAQDDEVLFAKGAEVKAYFTVKIPLKLGFSNMTFESGSSVDLSFASEVDTINSAVLRSEVINSLPIGGTLKLILKDSEEGEVLAEVIVRDENSDKLIEAAKTTADGEVTEASVNKLATTLTEEEVRALLNAGYLDMSFELSADADTDTPDLQPVQIEADQRMTFIMGILINGTIQLDL